MKTVAFYTLGCKVNTYETEAMIELFENNNYSVVNFNDEADIYVINTCTVTNASDSKSRKTIRKAKKTNKDACIIVAGCFAKLNEDELKEMEIDVVLGVSNKDKAVDYAEEFLQKRTKTYAANNKVEGFGKLKVSSFKNTTRAFLKIQDGCDAFCSYCIIPYARGTIISKPIDEIILEAKDLINNGYKEIVLTGIHTGKYGVDIGTSLEEVLKRLIELDGIYLIRLSSIEINEITDGILELLKSDKLAKHLHIPIQNANDQVLKDMNRKYTFNEFLDRINKIKSLGIDINFTTDYISGYPTESNEQHVESLENIKKIGFSKIHVFPFSKRSGTVAGELKDLNGMIKTYRVDEFIKLSEEFEKKYNDEQVGKVHLLLVETVKDGFSYGHTTNYLKVAVNEELVKNTIYKIRVISATREFVTAELA